MRVLLIILVLVGLKMIFFGLMEFLYMVSVVINVGGLCRKLVCIILVFIVVVGLLG